MSELPPGWVKVPVGDVCQVVGGSTPSTKVPEYWDGGIPWLTPDDLARDRSQYVSNGRRSITQAGYEACSTQMVPAGTVLFTSRAPIGYAAIAAQPLSTNQGFKSFVPPPGVSSEYLYWFLQWATPTIRKMGSGTTFAEISGKVARTVPLSLAPEREQERIVAAIDEQFSRLDAGRGALESARRRLDQLRAAAMRQALSGDWPSKSLADVTEDQTYGSSARATPNVDGGVPIVRMGNIRNGRVDLSGDVKFLPRGHPDTSKFALRPGDLLFNRTNSPELVGKSAVYSGGDGAACLASYLIRVRMTEACDPRWAALYLNSPAGRRWAASVRTQQVGQANINGTKLAAMTLPLPSVDEQARRLDEYERHLTIIDALASSIDGAVGRCDHLRSTILARAFSGRLVQQDPTDEPASELLARMSAERARAPKPRRRRRA